MAVDERQQLALRMLLVELSWDWSRWSAPGRRGGSVVEMLMPALSLPKCSVGIGDGDDRVQMVGEEIGQGGLGVEVGRSTPTWLTFKNILPIQV